MLSDVIRANVAPYLKEQGFVKKGTVWNRTNGEVVNVLDVQKGSPRRDGRIDFTLNVGIWMHEVWTICWARPTPDFIRETDCFPRFRIGLLLEDFNPKFRDKWWSLDSQQSVSAVGEELRGILKGACFPLFGRLARVGDVLSFVETSIPIRFPLERLYLGILRHVNGYKDQAEMEISELLTDSHWSKRAQGVLVRLRERDGVR